VRAATGLSIALLLGCGRGTGGDPFAPQPVVGAGGAGDAEGGMGGAAGEPAPPLAGAEPCVDDGECDDQIDCTLDTCDHAFGRCRHDPDDTVCDDHNYCDGVEVCDARLGCRAGPVVSCSDAFSCTIDTCIEATHACTHELRDADGDGDPPVSCTGTDCDDFDPLVSGQASERCGNQKDDDCDGEVDEADCVMPLYDRCGGALEVDAPGTYSLSTLGAAKDYAISCEEEQPGRAFREVVVAVTVPGDESRDIDLVATMSKAAPPPEVLSLTPSTFSKAAKKHAVALPDQVSAGELLLLLFTNDGSAEATMPPDWARLFTVVQGDNELRASAAFLIAGGSEGGTTVDVETAEAASAAAQVYGVTRWAGVGGGVSASGGPEDTSASADPPAKTRPWGDVGDNLWIAFAAASGTFAVDSYPMQYTGGTLTSSGDGTDSAQVVSAVRPLAVDVGDPGPFGFDQKTAWAAGTIVVEPMPHSRFEPGELVLAAAAPKQCGKPAGETACTESLVTRHGDSIARLVLRDQAPGAHTVYVAADREADIELHVDFREPAPAPTNETCSTSEPLIPGVPVHALLADVALDLDTACPARTGELVYRFDLPEASDVRLDSVALDDFGDPVVSLRDSACSAMSSELTCRAAPQSELYARALPAGSYSVALGGTGPAEVELVLSVSAATAAPPSEGCGDPPLLGFGVTQSVSLAGATDAVQIGCLVGAPDATYALELSEQSDVMLVQTGSSDDTGGVLVADAPCADGGDAEACASSDQWPVRTVAHGVGPGSLRAVVETASGNPTTLTAFTRSAVSSVFVQGADECADAFEIPATGGRFEGNTANQYAEYDASCDYGGQNPGGAPEQLLQLTLTERRRVVLDAGGSSYDTIVVVRNADGCPGSEVPGTCAVTYTPSGAPAPAYSFIDTVLDSGTYFVQIDGYNGEKGRWALEVFTSEVKGD